MATEPQIVTRRILAVNPATGETLGEFDCASDVEVAAAVERARAAQPAWDAAGVHHRGEVLRRFQHLLHARKEDVARLITREAGKPYVESLLNEVMVVLDSARFCAQQARQLLRPEAVPHGNPIMKLKAGRLLRRPHGVIGIISPWNFPFSIPAGEALAALVMGNAVVLKPSELTPFSGLELKSLLLAAGVPDAVFQVVLGDGASGAALIASPIDKLVFTGSVPTGRRVGQACAARLLPVLLELGGKDPMLVLDDADLDVASSAAVWGAFVNAGQACLSVERCYVHRSLHDRFLELCVEKTRQLHVGNGADPSTDIGPLIHERQVRIVEQQVEDALASGARVLIGGRRLTDLGPNFYAPTVLAGVDHSMRVMREETFGPLLAIMPFDSDDDAIRLANDSEFGLAASIFTRDRQSGERLATRIAAGTVLVNDAVVGFGMSEAPHGGVKCSGIGRTHGRLGLEEMTWTQYLDSDRLPRMKKVWWYGYGPQFARQMEAFTDWLFAPGLLTRLRGAVRSAPSLFRRRL
jgi:succinate-semialdehyde dehydrogenase/glutarate-semialdehyde dehydrogenase